MHNSLASRSRVSYEPYSEQQRSELLESLESFLNHDVEELELESVRQVRGRGRGRGRLARERPAGKAHPDPPPFLFLLTTCCLLLAAYYSLLTTHYSLLY
jgi:hypothetical protein